MPRANYLLLGGGKASPLPGLPGCLTDRVVLPLRVDPAGVTKLGTEIAEILTLAAAHGTEPLLAALERAVALGRWRADDVRSILATGGHAPRPTPASQALVLTLPSVPTRSLDAYRIDGRVDTDAGGDVEGGEVS